jgi:hypothetical protein
MAFRMAKLDRKNTGAYTARKVIPEDVRDEYRALYGSGPPGVAARWYR